MSQDNLPSIEDLNNLKQELAQVRQELEESKRNANPVVVRQINESENVLNTILEKGVEVFNTWVEGQNETAKYEIDKKYKYEEHRINKFDIIDKRSSNTKMVLVIVSLIVMCILAAIDKLGQGVIAVLVLVISTLFRDNIKDLFKDIYKGFSKDDNKDG